jgi:hypothetical protein
LAAGEPVFSCADLRSTLFGDVQAVNLSDQKFAEPVALSSTQPADRPLPR